MSRRGKRRDALVVLAYVMLAGSLAGMAAIIGGAIMGGYGEFWP